MKFKEENETSNFNISCEPQFRSLCFKGNKYDFKDFKEIRSSRKGVTVAGHLWTCFLIPTPAL